MVKNSFLHPDSEIHFGTYKPREVVAALDETEKIARERLKTIIDMPDAERTYDNTVLGLTRSTMEFETVISVVGHLEGVLGDTWRQAERVASARTAKLMNDIGLNEHLYQALIYIQNKPDIARKLSPARKKLLTDMIRDYERGGIKLPKKKRDELRAINEELVSLSTQFSQNVVIKSDKAGLRINTEAELKGIAKEDVALFKDEANKRHASGYYIPYSEPNYASIMSSCSVRSTRRAMYRVATQVTKRVNTPIAQRIVELRQKRAHILGFKNYADLAADNRMVKRSQVAIDFIDRLIKLYAPTMLKEFQALQRFAQQIEANPRLKLDISDIDTGLDFYYASKLREQTIGIDEQELKNYFVLDRVRDVMFETLQTLYGLTFKRSRETTWHEDVEVYDIFDEHKHHIATVWCDWFARKGKRNGAWMDSYYVAERAHEDYSKPHLGFVVANFDPPRGKKPGLLSLRDVETVWHEFGHFIHAALNKTELPELSGGHCRWDFVEAPSQIMENWVWEPEIMQQFARHYLTDKPLSEDTRHKLLASSNFRVASKVIRQFCFAKEDLLMYSSYNPQKDGDIVSFCQSIKTALYPLPAAPYEAYITNFLHIFAGGYSAGYYSYKWAESIQADLFSRFKSEGILNPKVGREYAAKILARGSEVEPQELIRDFLGRDSTPEAMLIRDGITH